MTLPNVHRWKKIIGPEYDVMVKRFLAFLNELKKYSEKSSIALPERLQEKLLNHIENQPLIPEDGIKNLMGNAEFMAKLPGIAELMRVLQNFDNRLRSEPEKLHQDLISIATKLPEASRTFFIKELNSPPKKMNKPAGNISKKENKDTASKELKRAMALLGALVYQYLFQELDRYHEKDIFDGLDNNTDFLLTFVSLMNSLLSQVAFQNTVQELLAKGDDESLLKAVRIDKSIVGSDILRHRIARAQLSCDMAFLIRLGNNIAYNPLAKEAMYYEAYIVLRTFWIVGLCLLKPKDMDNFLTCCGIPHSPEPESLKKFIERHIHPIYGK